MTRHVPAGRYTHDSFLKNLRATQFHINKNMYDEACVWDQVWKDEHPHYLNYLMGLGLTSSHLFFVLFSAFSFFSCVWHYMKNRAGILTNMQCHSLFQCVVRHQLPLSTWGAWGGCQRPESSGAAATLTSVRIPQGAHTCPPTPGALPLGF